MKTFRISIIASFIYSVAMPPSQAEDAPRSSLKLAQMLRDAGAPVYSCDLRAQFNQCREYLASPGQAATRLTEIEESCKSLGGHFAQTACPSDAMIARCREVKFRRDVYYDNTYYDGEPTRWAPDALEYACKHLPGQFETAPEALPPTNDPKVLGHAK